MMWKVRYTSSSATRGIRADQVYQQEARARPRCVKNDLELLDASDGLSVGRWIYETQTLFSSSGLAGGFPFRAGSPSPCGQRIG